MNYMSEVANMLGVELGEEFEIIFPLNDNCHATAQLNNKGLYIVQHNIANQDFWHLTALTSLLNGTYKIKRKPWKPEDGECYHFVDECGLTVWDTWGSSYEDILLYKLGNCYKTRQDADKDAAKWLEFYKSDEVLEV